MKSIKKRGSSSTAACHLRQPWEQFCFLGTLSASCLTTQQVLYDIPRLSGRNNINESFMP